ncbi:hypothetical protein QFC22_006506 [Naganishia vaughanmartiniae]|uniref:Uncharacterized protein n=1 Tax=Naganishia vaughanmartiniae TaxID=1424756 RepID=A0ACC2WJY4_9TREE|nr:hypothetical protein QFC22_006506 [Naganishia vaughanmartiniae]
MVSFSDHIRWILADVLLSGGVCGGRINTKLISHELEGMSDLVTGLSDGVKLIQLLEIMSGTPLGRYNPKPKMRVQKAENAKKALDFIRSKDVRLTNIGSEAKKAFKHGKDSSSGVNARPPVRRTLRMWKLGISKEVGVPDWLCMSVFPFFPQSFSLSDVIGNTQRAFDVAQEHLGIPQLLEVSDLCGEKIPDERSGRSTHIHQLTRILRRNLIDSRRVILWLVITYVAEFFHAFASLDKAEVTARRVEKFATMLSGIQKQQQDYVAQAKHLRTEVQSYIRNWAAKALSNDLYQLEKEMSALYSWKTEVKRPAAREKAKAVALFGNIQTRLSENRLRSWEPPSGLSSEDLDNDWRDLLKAETSYMRKLDAHYKQLKQAMKEEYGSVASALIQRVQRLNTQIAHMSGSLQEQKALAQRISLEVGTIKQDVAAAAGLSNRCTEAKIDWGDLEPIEDLEYEAQLLEDNIAAKLRFIENELIATNHSNVTKDKLLEWQATWQHFCDEEMGYQDLDSRQLQAALASLGHVYSTEDFLRIYDNIVRKHGAVTYEAFADLLVTITEDSSSPEQLIEAFRLLAQGDDVVTGEDLRRARISPTATTFLSEAMPNLSSRAVDGGEGDAADNSTGPVYDYRAFLQATFAEA